jgi:hypothetical protein
MNNRYERLFGILFGGVFAFVLCQASNNVGVIA